jgi:hypothetical protein
MPQTGCTYRLYRQFQSYSQLAHRITVQFRTTADEELRRGYDHSSEAE